MLRLLYAYCGLEQGLDIQGQNIELALVTSCGAAQGSDYGPGAAHKENDNLATTISHHSRLCLQLLHASWSLQREYIYRN